jgi:N-acetylglucosamine malate deacetylase 1
MDTQPLDVMAVGAHPDDIEIACGGTLAKLARRGYLVGIVDLTDGEPTPGSPGPAVRLAEARQAAEMLGAWRVTLDLPNRRLFDSFETRVALACEFRKHRPKLVIGLGGKSPMGSPDHYQASLLTEAAVFYSRLTKWDEQFQSTAPHTIQAYIHCFLAFRGSEPVPAGSFVSDISDTLETKMAAIACYKSQFPPEKSDNMDRLRCFSIQQGAAAGFQAGELLASPTVLGTRDLMGLLGIADSR